jgi:hypothetical protein
MRVPLIGLILCAACLAQSPSIRRVAFEGSPALVLSNDKLEITVTLLGGSFARLLLRDDASSINPFWEPVRMSRELGGNGEFRGSTGHFVCVDGFGPVSAEERAAGLPGHGEAHTRNFELRESGKEGTTTAATIDALLPIVQERFTRTVSMVDGENVIYVDSRLSNMMGFDRPVNWAEHATVGSPFLESNDTVVDVSGVRSMTRPYDQLKAGGSDRRLMPGREFHWPSAPALDGSKIDLRQTPPDPHYLDHATTLVDPGRKYGWTTALNVKEGLIIGYVFRRAEFPWVQYWGNYPPTHKMSRGLEFSSQPFDVPRREAIGSAPLFGAPTYRWLPAKSSIEARFLIFYAKAPEGMRGVDDIRVENGALIIEDRSSGKTLTLAASLGI